MVDSDISIARTKTCKAANVFLCYLLPTDVKCTMIEAITFVQRLCTGHVRSDNYTWLCVSCVWAAGPLQSGSVSLQAKEAESVPGLWSSGCAGVLLRPTRHRRWTTPTLMPCSKPISITTTPTLCHCKSGKTNWKVHLCYSNIFTQHLQHFLDWFCA